MKGKIVGFFWKRVFYYEKIFEKKNRFFKGKP